MGFTSEFLHVPSNARKIDTGSTDVAAYVYQDNKQRLYGMAFVGEAHKPLWHDRFKDDVALAKRIGATIVQRRETVYRNAERKAGAA